MVVSEVAGEPISAEQLDRLYNRYAWARQFCSDRDVLEVACGTGAGLGLLGSVARSLEATDYSEAMVQAASAHYRNRFTIRQGDAQQMLPFADASKDVIIVFEALYYLSSVGQFLGECRRVLRPSGYVLVTEANKDLPDFNPSPFSHAYHGARELKDIFSEAGFEAVECFGYLPIETLSARQRVLRPVKRLVVTLGLMPRTMKGKRLLKRIVFGSPVPMPQELTESSGLFKPPTPIRTDVPDDRHKVIYCAARLGGTP